MAHSNCLSKCIATIVVAVLLALCALALPACAQSASPSSGDTTGAQGAVAVGPDETWSVFVYMCGSNLESQAGYATRNIIELQEAATSPNVNFVIETGGANEWWNEAVDARYLGRYTVSGGKLFLQDQVPRSSMGDPDTLADFLAWGVENYPADHYMLVFWDHGGGSLSGVCLDEGDHDTLTLPEIRDGIAAAGVTFDIVGFDTCLMATLETAQLLAPYAHYMVASEEVEPACGWAWADWPAWFEEPTGDVVGLGQAICDSYLAKCESYRVASTATLSVVDLSCIDEVAGAFEMASRDMASATEKPGSMQRLEQQARSVQAFGHANYLEGYTDMVDLRDLAECTSESLSGSADAVKDAIDRAVVYAVHGPQSAKSTGLSVFYPLKIDYDTFVKYFKLSTENNLGNIPYLQFLAAETGAYDMVNWNNEGVANLDPIEQSDAVGAFAVSSRIDSNGRYVVDITGNTEFVADATKCQIGQLLDDGTVVMLGSDNNIDLDVDPNGAVHYTDRFNGGWYKIGDAYVYADLVDQVAFDDKPAYNLYSTPVEWTTRNSRGTTSTYRTNLLSMYDYATNSYHVLCVYDEAEDGMVAKATAALTEGDTLRFLVSRNDHGREVSGSTGTIRWTDDTEMTMAFAGNVTYVYMLTVTDLFGNEYTPDPALITFAGGKRTAELVKLNQM